jgi:hypothetical protein
MVSRLPSGPLSVMLTLLLEICMNYLSLKRVFRFECSLPVGRIHETASLKRRQRLRWDKEYCYHLASPCLS